MTTNKKVGTSTFNKIILEKKIITICFIFALIVILVGGGISYMNARGALVTQIEDKLKYQVAILKKTFEKQLAQISDSIAGNIGNEKTVLQQIKIVNDLINANMATASNEKLKKLLSELKIGKFGYAYILNYEGVYVLSERGMFDGENAFNVREASGRFIIQEIIEKGRSLSPGSFDLISYNWRNPNEKITREKVTTIFHIPSKRWILGVSSYYDDMMSFELKNNIFLNFKKTIREESVGKKGYVYVMNSRGELIVHSKQERKNIYHDPFVQQICREREGSLRYSLDGQERVAAYVYLPKNDYIIVSDSNLSDFTQEFRAILLSNFKSIIITILILLIVGIYVKTLHWFRWQ